MAITLGNAALWQENRSLTLERDPGAAYRAGPSRCRTDRTNVQNRLVAVYAPGSITL